MGGRSTCAPVNFTYRRFSTMPFSISLDLAAKGPHYEIFPILPSRLPTRVCDFGGLHR
jgi:hypothetical protein